MSDATPAAEEQEAPKQCQWMNGKQQCASRASTWVGSRWLCRAHFEEWLHWRKFDDARG